MSSGNFGGFLGTIANQLLKAVYVQITCKKERESESVRESESTFALGSIIPLLFLVEQLILPLCAKHVLSLYITALYSMAQITSIVEYNMNR
jgi:hypothetical protein